MEKQNQKFGTKLRELRTGAGLTLRELAEQVNVNFTYLSKIESGALPPPSEKVIRHLAEVLNADKDELLTLAGIIPADIAELLKDRKTLERLRAEQAKRETAVSRKLMSMPKVSVPLKGLYRLALPVFLVIAIAASLWYAAPTQALTITFPDLPSSGTLGSTVTLKVSVNIEDNELLPLQQVDIRMYKDGAESSYKATLSDLPKNDSGAASHNPSEGTSSGTATVAANADANWDYWHGSGYAYWKGQGYTFSPSSSYGYGYTEGSIGTTSIIYTIQWTPPSGWPAGNYKIKVTLTTSTQSPSSGTTFIETSGTFALSSPSADYGTITGDGGGAAEEEEEEAAVEETTSQDILTADDPGQALADVATTDVKKAGDLLEEVATEDIVTAGEALEGLGGTDAVVAGDVLEEVVSENPELAGDIIDEVAAVDAEVAGDILDATDSTQAATVMQNTESSTLDAVIPEMSVDSLTERLPKLTVEKLLEVNKEVLLNKLVGHVPTEQVTGEITPEVVAGLEAPVTVVSTPNSGTYLIIRTADGWVQAAATPAPIEKLLIKTARELSDVTTTIKVLDQQPAEVLRMLPSDQIINKYITISFENAEPGDIELGHITFYVEQDWLEENSIHKWSVALYQFDRELNKWIALPTKRVAEDDTYIDYTAVITHFSAFAIAGSEALPEINFETNNLSINPAEAETGEDITISADVTNTSTSDGTFVATLWINDTVEAGKNVYVEAGQTASASFTVTPAAAGSYEVRVDRLLGSFSVTEAAPPAAPPEEVTPPVAPPEEVTPPAAPPEEVTPPVAPPEEVTPPVTPPEEVTPTNWWLIGGIIAAVIIIAIVVWLVLGRRRD